MDCDRKPNKKLVYIIVGILIASFLISGIVLTSIHKQSVGSEEKINYTECKDDSAKDTSCEVQVNLKRKTSCICYINFNLSAPIIGPVTVYYELPDFDQNRAEYASSKDEAQLAGKLSPVVSKKCGNFSYGDTAEGKMPIAPCGQIADSMFFDAYSLIYNGSILDTIDIGLNGITEEDKKQYRNPPGDLKEAFQNFTHPNSWLYNVTQLDLADPSNNGFQNEKFIGWMKTDMKRKPAFRFNTTAISENGLPVGTYWFRVKYYPSNYVTGSRIAIISSVRIVPNMAYLIAGIVLISIGLCLAIGIVLIRVFRNSYIPCKTEIEK